MSKYEAAHYRAIACITLRGAESESEPDSESESPGVMATSQESGPESVKLPRLRLRNVLLESVI